MAHADIRIELEGGTAEGAWRRYAPGDVVSGTVHVRPEGPVECRHLWVRLQWHTEGRGDRDSGNAAEVDIHQGQLPPTGISYPFRFILPSEPWSYAGRVVSIVWGVMVELDVSWIKKPKHIQSFIVAPPNEAAKLADEPVPVRRLETPLELPAELAPERPAATAPTPGAAELPAGWDVLLISPGLNWMELGRALMEVVPAADRSEVQRANSISPLRLRVNVSEEEALRVQSRLQAAGATVEVRPSGG